MAGRGCHLLTIALVLSLPGLLDRRGDSITERVEGFDSVSGCLAAGARWAALAEKTWRIPPKSTAGWSAQYYCTEKIAGNSFHYPPDASRAVLQLTFDFRKSVRLQLGLADDGVAL